VRSVELIGRRVVDSDGQDIGRAHDIRLEAGATPRDGSGTPAYGICALIVGPVAIFQRFGYGRREMAGPWPLTYLFRALARRSLVVPWSEVEELQADRITIACRRDQLDTVHDVAAGSGRKASKEGRQ